MKIVVIVVFSHYRHSNNCQGCTGASHATVINGGHLVHHLGLSHHIADGWLNLCAVPPPKHEINRTEVVVEGSRSLTIECEKPCK